MTQAQEAIVHATAVAVGVAAGTGAGAAGASPAGVLLRGASGAGKSDLALRLIDSGATLIADDRTVLRCHAAAVLLFSPEAIRGRLEVRGLGIVPVDHVEAVPLALVIDLADSDAIERMPAPRCETLLGIVIPAIALDPFESSAPAKVRLAVRAAACGIIDQLD